MQIAGIDMSPSDAQTLPISIRALQTGPSAVLLRTTYHPLLQDCGLLCRFGRLPLITLVWSIESGLFFAPVVLNLAKGVLCLASQSRVV